MTGRIEVYIHSDSTTKNKGMCAIKVETQTDFAARTEDFIKFCSKAAMMSYGIVANNTDATWTNVANEYPTIETVRLELEKSLKERITVSEITVMKL